MPAYTVIVFLPVVFSVYYIKSDLILAIFFGITLIIVCVQYVIVSVSQAFFLSGKNIFSELIRSVSYISAGFLLLTFTGLHYMYSMFCGIFLSFFLSGLYLFVQVKKELDMPGAEKGSTEGLKQMLKSFLAYGGPIFLWFVFSYSIALIDKYFMLHSLGAKEQGNYQALFDFLARSINMLCSPVIIALFPLITEAYKHSRTSDIKKLLSRIIFIELAALAVALTLYWWLGASILSSLIKIPNTIEYKLMGAAVIAGAFMWQIGVVVHKYYEMKLKNMQMLVMIAIAFVVQLGFYWLFNNKTQSRLIYPAGYCLAAFVYLILVSSGVLKSILQLNKRNK